MASAIKTGKRNPFDSGGPLKLDISEDIDVIAPERDTPLLSMLGWGPSAETIASATMGADSLRDDCTSTTHTWLNDELVLSQGTIDTDYVAAGGTISVGTAEVLAFRVDDVIRVKSTDVTVTPATADVFYLITAINTGAGDLSVTALNTDQNLDSGDSWYLLGSAKKVGASANTDGKHTVIAQTSNFTQIFSDDVFVTGTEGSVEQYGFTDPFAREISKTAQRMIVNFERAVHYNIRSSTLPADSSTASRMGGLFYYLRVASPAGLSTDLAGAPLSESVLDEEIDRMWRAGGRPDTLVVNSVGMRELKKFNRAFTETPRGERTAGLIVDTYETSQATLKVVLDRHLENSDILILTMEGNHVGVGPLKGNGNARQFMAEEVPQDGGDYRHVVMRGEYTMEVRNRFSHHNWLFGGATSVS